MFFNNKKREVIAQVKYPLKDYPGFIVNNDVVVGLYENKRGKKEKPEVQSKIWNG